MHRRYHIMLVEDSTTQATKLTAVLEQEGWEVTWASSAEEAFEKLRHRTPDLLLLDYYLPGMRGDEVCRRLRMNIDSRNLPVVMLTAGDGNEVRGLDSGADDFVVKSANPEVLILRLRTLLNKAKGESRILQGSEDSFRSARLMAIDDSPAFLQRLRGELETEGYNLETFVDPRKGLERVGSGRLDLVIVDLVMPAMDGTEVCRRVDQIRKKQDSSLMTIMVTGVDTQENLSRALEAGADDFVGKSNDFSSLKGRIRALLRRKFFSEENSRIVNELRMKELEALRERAAKEAAEARAALVEELQARTQELHRSQEELQRANEAKDRFLAVLSHELRTPLTPILTAVTHRCEDDTLPDEIRDDLVMIKRNVELEARLIDDLLDLTRITKGKLEMRDEAVDLVPIVRHVVEMCRSAERAQAEIVASFTATHTTIQGDGQRITQVVWNLLRNAVKFTPADGTIQVRLFDESTPAGRRVVLEVQDSGIGIEPEALGRIFNAFEQANRQVTRQFGGLGLGLAISKAIVDLHEGELSVRSAGRDQGATFRMALPVVPADALKGLVLPSLQASSPPGAASDSLGSSNSPVTSGRLRILLVEDHLDTAAALSRLLTVRGFEVRVANTCAAAIASVRDGPPIDLLITDLGLPDNSGFEVQRQITSMQSVPSIALSGYGMESDIRKSLGQGFSAHLTKPLDFKSLEREIGKLFPSG